MRQEQWRATAIPLTIVGVLTLGAVGCFRVTDGERATAMWVSGVAGMAALLVTLALLLQRLGHSVRNQLTLEKATVARAEAALTLISGAPVATNADAIVGQLAAASTALSRQLKDVERSCEQLRREYSELLLGAAQSSLAPLTEVELALHILLEHRFGELNENQVEMLEAARTAMRVVTTEIDKLRKVADMDFGTLTFRLDAVRIDDVLRALEPVIQSRAEATGRHAHISIAPGQSALTGDRSNLYAALDVVFREALACTPVAATLRIRSQSSDGQHRISVSGFEGRIDPTKLLLSTRVIRAHDGSVLSRAGRVEVTIAGLGRASDQNARLHTRAVV